MKEGENLVNIYSDDKVLKLHTKSFLNLVNNLEGEKVTVSFEHYSDINPISDLKYLGENLNVDTSNYGTYMKEDVLNLIEIADGFKRIDQEMADTMGKKG